MLSTLKFGRSTVGRLPFSFSFRKCSTAAAVSENKSFGTNFYNPLPQQEDSRPINPKYWTGSPAIPFEEFQIDCAKFQMNRILQNVAETDDSNSAPISKIVFDNDFYETKSLIDEMRYKYDKLGAIHLINTGLKDMESMKKIAMLRSDNVMEYTGGANQRQHIEKDVYDTGAPPESQLHYHHEMAGVAVSTKWLAFLCKHGCKDPTNGSTYISDNVGATDTLMNKYSRFGNKLKEKGLCYIRKLPDLKYFKDNNLDSSVVYNFWQTSMQTEDMDEAAEVAKRSGLEVDWQDSPTFGRYMVTKYRVSAFEYDPSTDRNLLYSSMAGDYMTFDCWPGIKDLPHWERPLKLNFGDDEVMTREEKQQFVDVYDANGIPIYWRQGDIAVICNLRTAHGKPGFSLEKGDKRELGVIIGERFSRIGDIPEKW